MMNHAYLDRVVETETLREVVGVVHDRAALETLEECLMESGFDRGDIDIMGNDGDVDGAMVTGPLINSDTASEAADYQRHEVLTHDDETGAHVLAYGTLMSLGGIGAAVLAEGAAVGIVAASVLVGGAIGGGIGRLVRNRIVGAGTARKLEHDLLYGGVALLLHVRDDAEEMKAVHIMSECGAENVHSHDVDMMKTLHEIPFAGMNPDPWLGSQRLGG